MVSFRILFLVTLLATSGAACGMDAALDELEISTGKAEQVQVDPTPIVLNATYEDVILLGQPGVFSLLLHDGDEISVVLENVDDGNFVWPELYQERIDPENAIDIVNDLEDSLVAYYQIQHPWGTPFRKKYILKVRTTGTERTIKYRLRVICDAGPCKEDPAGDLLTDRMEPNNIRFLSRLSLGIETNLLNLDSGKDVDWMKIPIYKYTTPYITAVAVGPDRKPVPGIQVSAWYECTRGYNYSTCDVFPNAESHTSYVYPELGPVSGCHGDHDVSIKRKCLNDYGRNGQLFVRVSWKEPNAQPLTYYKILIL